MGDRKAHPNGNGAAGKSADQGGVHRAADEAAARAKREGAVGPNGPAAQRSSRDSAIVARAAAGTPQRDVAEEFGISIRTVRAVVERARKSRSPLDEPPMEVLEHALRVYQRQHADFYALAWRNVETNPHVSLGALRAAGEALDRYLALLTDLGKLPANLSLVRDEAELIRIGQLMCEKLLELADGKASAQDCIELFERLLGVDTPLEEEPPEARS